ncbi:chaplin [Streptomyces sp. RS10V-4]|uniref:chaplin n=1 Tax=Streptomyces rhizoryzae TaxID=2932493 RepID=UPI002002EF2A|nr:chaplin [Streptomyces rhizoryzae]MCK7624236.1 chaplin [Streptomyces rhizoryzae]
MRQSLKTCVLVAAASGVLGAGAGPVFADAGAHGGAADSPGVLSGNTVTVEVNAPVNVCGNSVNGVGLLNPAMGNGCGNGSAARPPAPRPPLAAPPQAPHRAAPARRAPDPEPRPQRPHRQAAPSRPVAAEPAGHDPRVGEVARAGKSAGEALLASSGAERLGLAAGAGGGLLLGGVVLLRRARKRRG